MRKADLDTIIHPQPRQGPSMKTTKIKEESHQTPIKWEATLEKKPQELPEFQIRHTHDVPEDHFSDYPPRVYRSDQNVQWSQRGEALTFKTYFKTRFFWRENLKIFFLFIRR